MVSGLDLVEQERQALESALAELGYPRFHAGQIFRWIYRRGVTDAEAMTDLPRELRAALAANFCLTTPTLAQRERSIDGTEKFVLGLRDGRTIESVFIPDTPAMVPAASVPATRLAASEIITPITRCCSSAEEREASMPRAYPISR